MRFMVMHKVDAQMEAGAPPSEHIIQQMGEMVQGEIRAGVFKDGAGLHRSALRVRLAFDGGTRTVVRGPYQGSNELLASFAMIKAKSVDDAIEIATRVAKVAGDREIEIGPVVEPWDIGVMARPAHPPLRFLLLRKADRAFESGAPQPAALRALLDELKRDDVLLSSATLLPSSTGARSRRVGGKRTWTDGPFTESKELVAGYSIVELPSLELAKTWADRYGEILVDNEIDIRAVAQPE
jgi:hypothetical protein